MSHIKKFNEIWMRGGEDTNGNPHYSTDTDPKKGHNSFGMRPELEEFFNKFAKGIIEIKNKLDNGESIDRYDLNWIEELYSTHKDHI